MKNCLRKQFAEICVSWMGEGSCMSDEEQGLLGGTLEVSEKMKEFPKDENDSGQKGEALQEVSRDGEERMWLSSSNTCVQEKDTKRLYCKSYH